VLFPVHANLRFRWLEGERYSAVIGGFRRPLWRREPVEVTVDSSFREEWQAWRGQLERVALLTVYQIDTDVWAALPGRDRCELSLHWEEVHWAYSRACLPQVEGLSDASPEFPMNL
jgi:hypothetical protein